MNLIAILVSTLLVLLALVLIAIAYNGVSLTAEPGFSYRVRHFASTNQAQTDPNSVFPELRWHQIDVDAEAAAHRVREISTGLGWLIESSDLESTEAKSEQPGHYKIDAVVRSRMLRFDDNIRIEIQQVDENVSNIAVISTSNVGKGDFGANLAHITELRKQLDPTYLSSIGHAQ